MNTAVARTAVAGLAVAWGAAVLGASGDRRAPLHLSETGLYAPGQTAVVDPRNRAYSPQYPLWSDGAGKQRWVFLPEGTTIDAADEGDWTFPIGTRFWKEFAFDGRKVETRFLWRASADQWVWATYVWNAEQTDAVLAPDAGVRGAVEIAPGKRHDIPGSGDCVTCHGTTRPGPLGFNALELSTDRDPGAIHGEPLAPGMVTLATLLREGRLAHAREDLVVNPPRISASSPRTRAVLGYFAANCGTCHNRSGEIGPTIPSLKHSDLADGDGVARALLGRATTWQVPGRPAGSSVLIDGALPDAGAMLYRMRSRRPSSQMPPLGTVLRDDEAVAAIEQWIAMDLVRR